MYMYTVCVQVYIHFHNATRLTSTLLKKKCLSLLNNNNTEEIQVPKIKLTIILLRCSRCNDIDHNFKFFDASFLIVDPHWFFFFFFFGFNIIDFVTRFDSKSLNYQRAYLSQALQTTSFYSNKSFLICNLENRNM